MTSAEAGNGHLEHIEHIEEELAAIEDDLAQQGLSIQTLLDVQGKFQAQVVADVSRAVASLLEQRLLPLELQLVDIRNAVGDLALSVNVALRRF